MHALMKASITLALLFSVGILAIAPALAGDTPITNFSKNFNAQQLLNTAYPSGIFTPSNGFNTTFNITSDANGNNSGGIVGAGTTLNIPVGVAGVTNVFTLINCTYPNPNISLARVEFIGSAGADQVVMLINGVDDRDFYHGSYANSINGTTTRNAFSVTNLGGAGGTTSSNGAFGLYVIDEQNLTLDPIFTTQTLSMIRITSMTTGVNPLLLGLTVRATPPAVPEASSFTLLGMGLLVLGFMARKSISRRT